MFILPSFPKLSAKTTTKMDSCQNGPFPDLMIAQMNFFWTNERKKSDLKLSIFLCYKIQIWD